jgi:hypothetical protein
MKLAVTCTVKNEGYLFIGLIIFCVSFEVLTVMMISSFGHLVSRYQFSWQLFMAVSCPGSSGTLLLISVYFIHINKKNTCTVILTYLCVTV